METPRIEIDLKKISHNAGKLKELYGSKGISVMGVTKVVCGDPEVAEILIKSGIKILADSRISNIKRMKEAGIKARFVLLRSPAISQAESAVKYVDISLNSELTVIEELSRIALLNNTMHKIILMVELGDLREGIMPAELLNTVKTVKGLKGVIIAGIGSNLACFGGVAPDEEKMGVLSTLASEIEDEFDLKLEFVSGGNSANYLWFISSKNVGRINNLRIGESIFMGCETLDRMPIPLLFTDAFKFIAEVIEVADKPSKPYGTINQDAFGNTPEFSDNGKMRRAVLNAGLQDITFSDLEPVININVLGGSSDHMIVEDVNRVLKAGDEVEFNLNYAALLRAMTSPFVIKNYYHLEAEQVLDTYQPHVVNP